MKRHVYVRWKNRDEQGHEPPGRRAAEWWNEKAGTARQLCGTADEIQRVGEGEAGRDHRHIGLGIDKMIDARQDKENCKEEKGGGV